MKTVSFFTLLLLAFVSVCNSQPKIWSVSKDAALKSDFSEIQAAIDAASSGDYIYVYPSVYENGFTLGIPLIIVGPGYFLGDNPNTQVNKSPATIKGEVTIGTNSSGTILTGLNIENKVTIQSASNILIKRNRIHSMEISSSTNILIKGNYIHSNSLYKEDGSFKYYSTINVKNNCASIIIQNNFITTTKINWGLDSEAGAFTYYSFIRTESTTSSLIENNVLNGHFTGSNITFKNNISRAGVNKDATACSFYNNISSVDQFGTANGNQANVSMTTVFIGNATNPSADGQWQLKNGSPAKGAGLDGIDCGMFGGSDPYVLSGVPDIPAIYFFEAPDGASTTNGLPVHVKIKSRQ
jgi:hypothetical protein